VIGIDMTADMVSKARANAAKVGATNVEFRLGEIEHMPVADASVDVILSNCVINLSPDKRAVFREALRVLKDGGRLAISDVVATAAIPDALRADMQAYTGCISGAAHVDELRAMLTEVGFSDVRITVKEESRALMGEWFPGTDAKSVVASATIEATKRAGACCQPGCCA
jgi:SAM-dependent methyltransferase